MEFDVICGNPPYQLSVGNDGGNSSKAKAIYHKFIEAADKLNAKHIVMIVPSRWMTRSAEGISDDWIDNMLSRHDIKQFYDYETSLLCFPNLDVMGGVGYFHIERGYDGVCHYVFNDKDGSVFSNDNYLAFKDSGMVIRNPKVLSILSAIENVDGDYYSNNNNMSSIISPKDYFTSKTLLTSAWSDYHEIETDDFTIKYYVNVGGKRSIKYISESQIPKNKDSKNLHKVYVPAANGSLDLVLGQPMYGPPNSVCSQTFLVIGYDPTKHHLTKNECENIITYIKTRFFRYLVAIKKKTQNGPRGVYQFVPMQDFSKPWTDAELYEKYGLDQSEIEFIESMIRPME